jgi:hypothetical protein
LDRWRRTSNYILGQAEDKTEEITSEFQLIGATIAKSHSTKFHIVFKCMYTGLGEDKQVYTGFLKESHVHLRKHESTRSYNNARYF